MKKHIINILYFSILSIVMMSCNSFLDKEPESSISSDVYFTSSSQLEAYANGLYTNILPSHGNWSYGTFGTDENTDNQAYVTYDNKYAPGQWKTSNTDDNWDFEYIYSCNYFLNQVLPKYKAKSINGSDSDIKQYIGEIYFLRAYEYFKRYQMYGDFPIITATLTDNKQELINASKRAPRNEVARFIIANLDTALTYLSTTSKTRINAPSALLLKSRVALFEGTWEKYFKGTAFVPGTTSWPGASKSYNSSFAYTSGSIDNEINYFLETSMDAAQKCAADFSLVSNTGTVQQSTTDAVNPYMDMFGSVDLSSYSEVLLWRQYSLSLSTHCVVVAAQHGDYGVGVTRGLVDNFLMANGLPIYATGSGYLGDDNIVNVRANRDTRLSCFLKQPGQLNILYSGTGDHAVPTEPYPDITAGNAEDVYSTGYALRKGNSYYQDQCGNGASYTGSITFRGVEAYLNYMEACYERYGKLDAIAQSYWVAIRNRAKVDPDYQKTIDNTDMSQEAKNDWGAYSAGQLISPTLYNIRRERRCELMAEGLRWMDLCRWRSLDQMITVPYHVEGFKVWGSQIQSWYLNTDGTSKLISGLDNTKANVSPESRSMYLRPYEKSSGSLVLDGYKWAMAQYLYPLPIKDILNTSSNTSDLTTSPLYQNPYWSTDPNKGAEE